MINNVVLVGRTTKDIELRYTSNNIATANFHLAVNRTYTGSNGEKNVDFISCVVYRKQAENLVKFVKKGHLIGIQGRIQTRNYQGKDGNTVYVTEVVADSIQYLESKKQNNNQNNDNNDFNTYLSNFNQSNNNASNDLFANSNDSNFLDRLGNDSIFDSIENPFRN